MNKTAKELIQKMAGVKTALSPATMGAAAAERMGRAFYNPKTGVSRTPSPKDKDLLGMHQRAQDRLTPSDQKKYLRAADAHPLPKEYKEPGPVKLSSDMKSIIDDIIKGAEQNTFGRPVSIQTNTEWTHFDTAKTAGALKALGEQGYSVKEASEYLGLTEAQIQHIVDSVR